MANGILGMLANPPRADIPGAIARGQGIAQNRNALQSQGMNLETQRMGLEDEKRKRQMTEQDVFAGVTEAQIKSVTSDLTAAILMQGDNQTKMIKQATRNVKPGTIMHDAISEAAAIPPGKQRDSMLLGAFNLLQAKGYGVPEEKEAKKTADQIERELADKETNTRLREAELNKKKEEKKSNLKILIDEKKALPPDSPLHEQYEQAIQKEATRSGLSTDDPMITTLASQVISGRLDPNKISKRGGLQQSVFAAAEQMLPGVNLVELEANARFKNLTGNLQSRALINGVQPLFNNLEKLGEDLHNSRFPLVNTAVNFAKEQFGDQEIVAFNNARDGIVAEVERILLGSGVLSDSKYQRALHNVNSAQSAPQLKAAVAQMKLEVAKRLEALDMMPFEQKQKIIQKEIDIFYSKDNTILSDPLGIR